jgi:cell division protein ZapA (FtsZ GTPase activity inhibitor)
MTLEKYSIKVNIINRIYPVLVSDSHEEERIRKAVQLIEEKVNSYKERFSVKDEIDLLAMCGLEFATEAINRGNGPSNEDADLLDSLKRMSEMILSSLDSK